MTIRQINIHQVAIPFSMAISHNLKERVCSAAIVVIVHTEDGTVGYGEGAPRTYVTGQSIDKTMTNSQAILSTTIGQCFQSLADLEAHCTDLNRQHEYPSLIAALEIALLDALGQSQQCSINQFLSSGQAYSPRYSAVLPFLPFEQLGHWLELIRDMALPHIKVKVGQSDDELKLELIRQILGDAIDIRLDANRAWSLSEAIESIKRLERFDISCVEEPLMAECLPQLPDLAQRIGVPLMLDESVYTLAHAQYFAQCISSNQLLFNLKISKSGGLLATAALHRFATSVGIDCQLGCNVGEAAILSAAGRLFAQTHPLIYLEGSFAPFFMEDDLGVLPISFRKAGEASYLTGEGLGIAIDTKKLNRYSRRIIRLN